MPTLPPTTGSSKPTFPTTFPSTLSDTSLLSKVTHRYTWYISCPAVRAFKEHENGRDRQATIYDTPCHELTQARSSTSAVDRQAASELRFTKAETCEGASATRN